MVGEGEQKDLGRNLPSGSSKRKIRDDYGKKNFFLYFLAYTSRKENKSETLTQDESRSLA